METRREFIKKSASAAGVAIAAPAFISNMITDSPNERINVAVIGIAGDREADRFLTRVYREPYVMPEND